MSTFPRQYPMMTPDSLRAKLHIDKKIFDTYLSRSFMRDHCNGSKYVGTMENWGSEMLMESHKLKMKYPPFNALVGTFGVRKYFDLHYGSELNIFYEPNAIVGCLKQDVLPHQTCYLRFTNCTRDTILRPGSPSDPTPELQVIYRTTLYPSFITLRDDGTEYPEPLKLYDKDLPDDQNTEYFFNTTTPNTKLRTDSEYIRNLIDPESIVVGEDGLIQFNTIPLNEWMYGQPLFWASIPSVSVMERGNVQGNTDRNNNPLLTFGTDGNDNVGMYPMIYGDTNLPPIDESFENVHWMLKVYGKHDDFTMTDYRTKELRKITFCAYDDAPPYQHIVATYDITWNTETFHVFLNTSPYRLAKTYWIVRTPRPGDSDYDGTTFKNPPYLVPTTNDGKIDYTISCPAVINDKYNPLFIVKPEIYYNKFRYMTPRAQVGMHIDFSSDYSDHAVDKKNGTIYNMGEFDGLPSYYKIKNARYVKRARLSLYTLRDWITSRTQTPMKRQSAGLLVDSGFPVLTDPDIGIDGLESVIKYKASVGRLYHTTGESVSKNNSLSDIAYYEGNKMYDVTKRKTPYQMIYHGHRFFSTRVSKDLDYENYGRVYVISNDPAEYDNNYNSRYPKPPRTLARICDIPTDFRQLTHISGLVSSVITDKWYVRTEACYSDGSIESVNGNDLQRVWNITSNETNLVHDESTYVFGEDVNLNSDYGSYWMDMNYPRWNNRNAFLTMTNAMASDSDTPDYKWRVHAVGTNYDETNIIADYVGGHPFEARTSVVESGHVLATSSVPNTKEIQMNRANLDGQETVFSVVTKSGSGKDCKMRLEIEDAAWSRLQPKMNGSINGCFAFKFNQYNQLTIWTYNPVDRWWYENVLLTGNEVVETIYNANMDVTRNTTGATLIRYMTKTNPLQISGFADAPTSDSVLHRIITNPYLDGYVDPNAGTIDASQDLLNRGYDLQDSYFVIQPDDGTNNILKTYENNPMGGTWIDEMVPKYSELALYDNIPRANGLIYNGLFEGVFDRGYIPKQPNVFLYNPIKDTHTQYTSICSDVVIPVKTTPITFKYYSGLVNDETDRLKYHVYKYTGNELSEELQNKLDDYHLSDRKELYNKAITLTPTFESNLEVNPVEYAEFHGVPYSKEQLIDYLMSFDIANESKTIGHKYRPTMNSNPIKKIRNAGEVAYQEVSGEIIPEGQQPTGDVVPVSARLRNHAVNIGESPNKVDTKPFYVFKLDGVDIESFDGFHMRDEYSNADISDKTLLIYENTLYVYNESYDTWNPLYRN